MHNTIVEWRKKRGLTQKELAGRVRISRPYLSDIERGVKSPSAVIAQRICAALDATFEVVFPQQDP